MLVDQVLNFEREGHVVTRGICTPEEIKGYTDVFMKSFTLGSLEAYRQKVVVVVVVVVVVYRIPP